MVQTEDWGGVGEGEGGLMESESGAVSSWGVVFSTAAAGGAAEAREED